MDGRFCQQGYNTYLSVFFTENQTGQQWLYVPANIQSIYVNGEGYKVAQWLNALGITAFVLKKQAA
jgi:hypothetical protein